MIDFHAEMQSSTVIKLWL